MPSINTTDRSASPEARVAQAVDEFLARRSAGDDPSVSDFVERYADIAAVLPDVLGALDALAQIDLAQEELPFPLDEDGDRGNGESAPRKNILGDYCIIRELGRGGMGIVYEAEQISLSRRVALKILPFAAVLDPRHLQRFKNEALAAAHLDHPNIVEVYGVGCERGVHFYAMRYVEGQTLAAVIEAMRFEGRGMKDEGRRQGSEGVAAILECDDSSSLSISNSVANEKNATGKKGIDLGNRRSVGPTHLRYAARSETESGDKSPHSKVTVAAALSTLRITRPKDYFRRIAELGIQAAEALDHAHQMGIVHRDIKPSNLMVESVVGGQWSVVSDGQRTTDNRQRTIPKLWITDFGLARVESDVSLTMTGDLLGTLRYMSPEQALAKRITVDHRTDIYSLGVTLYECLALRPVYTGEDREELLRQIAFQEPHPLRRVNPAIPVDLETIVHKAMAKNPDERFASAAEMAADLRRLIDDKPINARRPSFFTRMRKWRRRHAPLLWAAGVSVMIGLATAAATLGWTLRDRQLRLTSTHREMRLALDEATLLVQQENWPEALASVRRAEALSASMPASDELAAERLRVRCDIEMAMRLERIRFDQASTFRVDGQIQFVESISEYNDAFVQYGLDFEQMSQREAVERIRESAIAERLCLALDEWLRLAEKNPDTVPQSQNLLAIANEADPDPWRVRLREATYSAPNVRRARLVELAAAVQDRPLPTQTIILIARHLRAHGAADQAEPLLRAAYLRNPADFGVCFELGHTYGTAQLDEAIRFFSAAVARRPETACAHNNLGYALLQQGALADSVACFREAIRLQPDLAPAHNNLAFSLSKTHAINEAISHYRQAIELWPSSAHAATNLGKLFYSQGAYDEAIACLKEAIRRQPDFALAHHALGDAYVDNRDLDAAIASFRHALQLQPSSALLHDSLGVALCRKGALDEAIDTFRESIRLQPDVARVHCNLAHAFLDKGALDDAMLSFRETIRLDPDFKLAYQRLGSLCFKRADWKSAIDCFRHTVRLDAADPIAHYNLGNALLKVMSSDEAIVSLSEAIRLTPDLAPAHNALGNAHYSNGDLEQAILHWKETLRVNPDSAHALSSIGVVLHKQGDLESAVRMHRQAIALDPKYAQAHYSLACALRDLGEVTEALRSFEEALRLEPTFAPARTEHARLLSMASAARPASDSTTGISQSANAIETATEEKHVSQNERPESD